MTNRRRSPDVQIERAYDEPEPGRYRVLVDRLWPRGVSKERAALDQWDREVAPTADLRRWYGHDPDRFNEFSRRYRAELAVPEVAEAVAQLRRLALTRPLALVTATRDVDHSGAIVLREVIQSGTGKQ